MRVKHISLGSNVKGLQEHQFLYLEDVDYDLVEKRDLKSLCHSLEVQG